MFQETDCKDYGTHYGEDAEPKFHYGPEGIQVTLQHSNIMQGTFFSTMYNELQANFGNEPEIYTCDADLGEREWRLIKTAFSGGTLGQVLESLQFMFLIQGISRSCTHQIVRSRIGSSFMQQGGRDNDWRSQGFRIPETVRRACKAVDDFYEGRKSGQYSSNADVTSILGEYENYHGLQNCLSSESIEIYEKFMKKYYPENNEGFLRILFKEVKRNRDVYAMLVDMGIPYQDARQFIQIGSETYIFANYNYAALQGLLSKRLEFIMEWQINCVAQLMVREITTRFPAYDFIHAPLVSLSDKWNRSAFASMGGWPPDQKYPANYEVSDKFHDTTQMPFWILHPDSYKVGSKIKWIPTNGTYWSPSESNLCNPPKYVSNDLSKSRKFRNK